MKKYIKIFGVIVSLLGATSCNKSLDIAPEDYFADVNYWQTETQVDNFMTGIHSQLRGQQFQLFRLGELRGGALITIPTFPVSLSEVNSIENSMTEVTPGLGAWAGFMNPILQINLFIEKVNTITFLSDSKKSTLLGQAHGLRAFYYFHLLRTYGGVPLRTSADVLNSRPDQVALRLARSTEEETLALVKTDIAKSLENFGNVQGSNKAYWTLNATRMLKGEVFLWSAKVYGTNTDLAEAKTALEAVSGYSLLPNFANVIKTKRNAEIIFTLPFQFNEAEASASAAFLYDLPNFSGLYFKDTVSSTAEALVDPLVLQQTSAQTIQRYGYKYQLFQSFNLNDQRRNATFYDFYALDRSVAPQRVTVRNIVLTKFLGTINNNIRNYTDDWPIYREADRLLMLAEIANAQGENPQSYIQLVRNRAFNGTDPIPFVNGTKDANEIAIFEERMKEFVWEGKRWYDIRRMKFGNNPLVFQSSNHPYGVLNQATEAYKVLWPIGRDVWTNDPLVDQTPGYETTKP
ncbi:RagB/SusD family nutrient uptake outer membrane protein [Sphingobacterium bovistauri]|uniref:RagB/SusD family nutrient uptake outer membrane protein n=1 Tax=Sphingobacterium bovistauri TaxID=2781959 RepID=A0ABS7Z6R4_9SPHI|nr:RagB/SusD family nutrient uptake outer membrane protein [Sphingobacterium bovistauri]MCA5005297.1 RagB/SusD family nutrient uptake outer membrane protein [Sphingobacterium bovistauri]